MNLFSYGFEPFLGEDPLLLLNGGEGWRDVDPMNHSTRINPWPVLMASSKNVQIVPQEEGEFFADQKVGLRANVGGSVWTLVIKRNVFQGFC